MTRPVVHALIPAAGRGVRFRGSVLKQYISLAGKPIVSHAIDALNLQPEISGITVVLAAEDNMFGDLIDAKASGLITVIGGASRAESVLRGVNSIRRNHPQANWVLVHDAVRPCLPRSCLNSLLEKGLECADGAILAIPVQDTLKLSDKSGRIARSIDRGQMWAAQTPQLFPLERLAGALESSLNAGDAPTDEAGAMQSSGARPLLVMGSPANVKITLPDDLAIAEAWFARMNEQQEPE